ncbi:MAG: IS1380 family transposase [Actinomycetota bacterium]|nr:IS1380 family transposase [Actinomycetota bacterium]
MSTSRRRRAARLQAEASAIERRLARAVVPNMSGPVLGRANIAYELSARTKATAHGGIGMIAKLIGDVGLAGEIDSSLELLKLHKPYYESDHVLNIAYNALCGGRRLEDIEARRCDRVFLDGLGTESLPDPTTAGDFCRRFDAASIMALQEAINRARVKVWQRQPDSFFRQPAIIDADASIVPTDATTKQGMDISYKGIWGYSALLVSLANTKEPLYLGLLGANRPSHEGVVDYYDRAIGLCRQAGFEQIRLRGDTDFSLSTELDRWDTDGVRFVFGYDAKANLIQRAQSTDEDIYHELVTRAEAQIASTQRTRPRDVKDEIVRERNYKTLRQKAEDVVEFSYRPGKCTRDYRVVALRKNISVERGENVLFSEYRYFFYITNDPDMTADEIINEARQRCNQENLISQLKSGVRALHAPVEHPARQLGLHDHGRTRLEPESLVRATTTSHPTLGRTSQRATPPPAHHGLPDLPRRVYHHPLPNHHHRPTRTLAHPHLQPMAASVLPSARHPLTDQP